MFTDRLKIARNESRLSQKQLADKLFISQQAYGKYETGSASPNPETLQKIAQELNVSVDYLLGNTDIKETVPHVNNDEELSEYLEELRTRPEMRMLFQLSKGATKEDVEKAVKIIETLLDK